MATGFEFFERDLRLATEGLAPEAINDALAKFARKELRRAISEGIASEQYDRYVNGVKGAVEESVEAPGPIIYEFVNWPLVIKTALEELQRRAPRKSGRFAASFIVVAGGHIASDYRSIPADAEVIVTNAQPYVRKAEVGLLGIRPRRLFDGTKRVLNARFKDAFAAETRFLTIGAGVHPLIPYILKHSQGGRKDRQAGMPLTYPSIIINAVR
ncbi:hypothetical protein [Aquamicrobium soli]|uniref:Uncharacterized protein n=1 Tax=Aquamicrobium soli TaxID=1811518 RepID=A0ABV7K9X9_9HYPH